MLCSMLFQTKYPVRLKTSLLTIAPPYPTLPPLVLPRALIPTWVSVTVFSAFSIFPMCSSQIPSVLISDLSKAPILLFSHPAHKIHNSPLPTGSSSSSSAYHSRVIPVWLLPAYVYPLLLWALPCMVTTLDLFPFPIKSCSFMPLGHCTDCHLPWSFFLSCARIQILPQLINHMST